MLARGPRSPLGSSPQRNTETGQLPSFYARVPEHDPCATGITMEVVRSRHTGTLVPPLTTWNQVRGLSSRGLHAMP